MTTPARDPAAPAGRTSLTDELRALVGSGSRDLWLVYVATFFEYLGIFSFLQTLPLWLSQDFGMSDEAAGWWASAFSMLVTLIMFFAGALADTFGVRRMLVASFLVAAVTRLGMSLAESSTSAVAWTMAFALAYATASPVLQVAVNMTSRPAARSFAFSLWYVSFNLAGVFAGPLIDGIRSRFLDDAGKLGTLAVNLPLLGARDVSAHDAILACGFVFAALAAVVTLFLRRGFDRSGTEQRRPATNPIAAVREVVADPLFRRFMILLVLLSLVRLIFQHMHFTWPKYVTRVEGEAFPVGTVWSLNSLGIIFLTPLATALTRRSPVFRTLLVGAAISAVSPFILCFGSGMPVQVAMIAVLTVGEALWSPRLYEYNVAVAPPGREATYVGLAALPYFLAKFLVAPMSGLLLASYCPAEGPRQPAVLWAIIGASTIVGPIGMWLLRGWLTAKRPAETVAA
jgi:MFS family permease